MKKNQILLAACFLLLSSTLAAQKNSIIKATPAIFDAQNAMLAQIKKYNLFEMKQEELYFFAQKQHTNAFEIQFQFGEVYHWEFVLKPSKVHGDDFNFITDKGEHISAEKNITYEGFLKNAPETKVRMTISKHYVFGLILDENLTTFETVKDAKANADKALIMVYKSSQLNSPEKSCGHETEENRLPDFLQDRLPNQAQQRSLLIPTYCAKLGIVLDWQGLAKAGSVANFNTDIQTILNVVNGYYAVFNVKYELNPIYVITASPNPWADAPGAQSTLVANFRGWASPNLTPTNYNCALLFTGTNMNGIGYAYFAHMCQNDTYRFGEVDYQYVQPTTHRANLTTHELGHLWGAQHTGSSSTLIMSPSIWNGNLQWDAAASSIINTGVTTTFNSCLNNCTNFTVDWTSPTANQVFTNLNVINFAANASTGVGSISKVDFYVNNVIVGTDNTSPYSLAWTPPSFGSYVLKVVATDNSNNTLSKEISITVQNGQSITVSSQVNTSNDDAEQTLSSGAISLTSTDLELSDDGGAQEVGLRFTNINVPKNATITNAYIQFTVDETNSTTISLNIYGQDIGNAPTFTSTTSNITSRSKTSPAVVWSPAAWATIGDAGVGQQTSNISSIVQQIVNRTDWAANNAMVLLINGGVRRTASAYDGAIAEAPKLFISYTIQNVPSNVSINSQVNTSSDDAEQFLSSGAMNLTSTDLELADDFEAQEVGLRFTNINVPKNATITNAYIQFTVDETSSNTISLNIYGQDIGNAPTFTTTTSNITSRSKTSPAVVWSPAAWTTVGDVGLAQQTPNISSIIQKIVNRSDWAANNAMVFFVNGGVRRTASAYDGAMTEAPKLFITYTVNNAGVKVSPKVFLNNLNTTLALMPNDLANLSNFSLSDPYSVVPFNAVFTSVNNPTVATTTATVLATTGNNAIVDWIFLELRTGTNSSTSVVYTKSALLQRDGDVVATDGVSPVDFSSATAGNYYIAVRHRNHLGFRTANSITLNSTATPLNFTNNSMPLYGATPLISLTQNVYALISGDANYDGSIDAFDTILWEIENGLFDDYSKNSDYNLDGSVDAFDSILWEINNGKFEELD